MLFFFNSRFWTRNRPGDTAPDKSDETTTPKIERATGIIFKNIEPGIVFFAFLNYRLLYK